MDGSSRGPSIFLFVFICDIFGISENAGLAVWKSNVKIRSACRSPELYSAPLTSGVGMTKENAQVGEREARMGRRVNGKVSTLLTEIEKEDIPDRLLELARKLQTALNEKLER